MSKELEYIKIVHPDIYKKIEKGLLKTEVEIVMNGFLKHEVKSISDEEIKEIIFHNQCYGNSTKMVKEIKSLLKQ